MPYTVSYNQAERIIEVKIQGEVVNADVQEIYHQWVQLAKETECFSVLYDSREAQLSFLSTMDIYQLPRLLAQMAADLGIRPNSLRRAVVMPQNDDGSNARFAEAVTANIGQVTRFFQDMDAAKAWLANR